MKATERPTSFYLGRAWNEFLEFSGAVRLILLIIATIVIAAIATLEPIFMAKTIGFLEDFQKTGIFEVRECVIFLLIWMGFILINTALTYIHRYYIADLTVLRFHNWIAKKYIHRLFVMRFSDVLSKKSGSIYKDFDRGVTAFFHLLFWFFRDFLKIGISLIFALGIMLYFDWKMTVIALSMLPFMAIVWYVTAKKTTQPQKENNRLWTRAFGHIGNFFANMQLGKLLRLESGFGKKFSNELDTALHHQTFTSRWWSISDMITNIFVMISRFLVIGFGVYFIMKWELTIAGLILIFSYLGQIYYPLAWLFGSLPQLQRWGTEMAEFYEIFEHADSEDLETGEAIESIRGKIAFHDVNFGYHSDRGILHHLSLVIEPGQKIALVGNTGAGKSTLVSLLLRFWEPNSGKITLDERNIAEIRKSDLRRHIGMVAQDNSLFNLSIRENLLFAKPDATDDELRMALENASATFVYSLENGLDTVIGERGLKLSGGEKQRLSIARLFLQNPEILIFDEATSALDNKTEMAIQQSLHALMEGKTTIIIAHRLSTIRDVDRIFMLERGRVIESGKYDELVAAGGKFAELTDPSRLVVS